MTWLREEGGTCRFRVTGASLRNWPPWPQPNPSYSYRRRLPRLARFILIPVSPSSQTHARRKRTRPAWCPQRQRTPQERRKPSACVPSSTARIPSSEDIETLAAIDLEQMDAFMKTLDGLGSALLAEIRAGRRAAVKRAIGRARGFPSQESWLERALYKLSDLGQFAQALERQDLSRETKDRARETRAALEKLVIARTTCSAYEGSCGLSFQASGSNLAQLMHRLSKPFGGKPVDGHESLELPENWTVGTGASDADCATGKRRRGERGCARSGRHRQDRPSDGSPQRTRRCRGSCRRRGRPSSAHGCPGRRW